MPLYQVIAKGWVQGVGYRAHTLQCAKALQLQGTVRNCQNGTVEIWVKGEEQTVNALLAELQKYPNPNQLTQLNKKRVDEDRGYQGFEIIFDEDLG